MKKQIFLPMLSLFLGGFVSLTSCKKEKNDDPLNPSIQSCMLDHATTSGDSTQYTYDSENRITKTQRFNNIGNSQNYTLYTYSSNKIIEKNYDANSDMISKIDYHLNSNNYASYSVYSEDGTYDDADTTWYSYNSDKHNTRRVTKNTELIIGLPVASYDTIWYTYNDQNLVKKESRINNGSVETTVYSYGSNDAKSKFLAPEQLILRSLFGVESEKLATSVTTPSTTNSYVYQFNSEGYVKQLKVIESGTTQGEYSFYYNCK